MPVYSQAEKLNIKTGDPIIYKPSNLLGKGICTFTKSDYSHTGTGIVICGFVFVLEAKADGVQLNSFWDSIEGKDYEILRLKRPLKHADKLISDLEDIVRRGYDGATFLKHTVSGDSKVAKILRNLLGLKIDERIDQHICSGLSVWVLETYGDFKELKDVNSSGYVPGDFKTDETLRKLFLEG